MRANAILCRSPPDKVAPCSPTVVSNLSGSRFINE